MTGQQNLEPLFLANNQFSLSTVPTFKNSFDKSKKTINSSSSKTKAQRGSFLNFNDVIETFNSHNHGAVVDNNECRFLVMSLTGMRFTNIYQLAKRASFVKKRCRNCSNEHTCQVITDNCFGHATIHETKNGSDITIPILPQIEECIGQLSVADDLTDYKSAYETFNFFMKQNYNCTVHKVRQILPNLMVSSNSNKHNTGGWKSKRIMLDHYIGEHLKFVEAYCLLKGSGGNC